MYCFRAIKLICWFAQNFFREIYVGNTTDYPARYCAKETCAISMEYEYFFREISIGDLIGNFSNCCARELYHGDTGGHYCAKAIEWYFAWIHISLMQYHLTNSTTQTINYTYDKLNQLTLVSNYDNLELENVYINLKSGKTSRHITFLNSYHGNTVSMYYSIWKRAKRSWKNRKKKNSPTVLNRKYP